MPAPALPLPIAIAGRRECRRKRDCRNARTQRSRTNAALRFTARARAIACVGDAPRRGPDTFTVLDSRQRAD